MTPAPDEYVNLRMDIAELRGVVTGTMQSLQDGQNRHEERLNRVDVEFDQVHARYNRLEGKVSGHDEAITTLKGKDGSTRANVSLWIAGAGVLIALASKITWA